MIWRCVTALLGASEVLVAVWYLSGAAKYGDVRNVIAEPHGGVVGAVALSAGILVIMGMLASGILLTLANRKGLFLAWALAPAKIFLLMPSWSFFGERRS